MRPVDSFGSSKETEDLNLTENLIGVESREDGVKERGLIGILQISSLSLVLPFRKAPLEPSEMAKLVERHTSISINMLSK